MKVKLLQVILLLQWMVVVVISFFLMEQNQAPLWMMMTFSAIYFVSMMCVLELPQREEEKEKEE